MKHKGFILLCMILLTTLFFISCNKETRLESNENKSKEVNFRENACDKEIKIDKFYLNLFVPKSWYVLSDEERNNLFFEVLDKEGVYNIFSAFEEDINGQNNTKFNCNLYVAAEDISITNNVLKLDKYIEKLFKDMKNSEIAEIISLEPVKHVSLDGKDGRESIIKISYPNIDIEQEYNFIIYKNYIYVFVSTYSNEIQKESLKKIIKSIKLK